MLLYSRRRLAGLRLPPRLRAEEGSIRAAVLAAGRVGAAHVAAGHAPATIYTAGGPVRAGRVAAWFALRPPARRPGCALAARPAILMALLTVAISPHYPWYFAWLAMPCRAGAVSPRRPLAGVGSDPALPRHLRRSFRSGRRSSLCRPSLLAIADCAGGRRRHAYRSREYLDVRRPPLQDPRRYFEAIAAERTTTPRRRRSASIWRSPTAAICCARPARARSRSWSRRPT